MNINIDMAKLDAIIAKAQPEYAAKLAAKPKKKLDANTRKMMTAGFIGIDLGPIDAVLLTFCAAWPKVRTMINVALRVAGWIPGYGPQIALAKAWVTAFNDEIVPELCQPTT